MSRISTRRHVMTNTSISVKSVQHQNIQTAKSTGNLIIKRGEGDCFSIGDDITVCFLSFLGGQAKISIRAPKGVKILRSELEKK